MAETGEQAWPDINWVGDVMSPPGLILGERSIPDYELVYFPVGTDSVYERGSITERLDKPCMVLTRPGVPHLYRFDPQRGVRHLFVHFEYGPLQRREERFIPLLDGNDVLPLDGEALLPGMMRQLLVLAHLKPVNWPMRVKGLLVALLEEMVALADPAAVGIETLPAFVARALAYMDERLAEPLTIREIAAQSGWSHEHFSRVFLKHVGMSPKRALLERRMALAEKLMADGELTVKQIAYRVGFGDEHHFSKMYKQVRGINASVFMKRCEDPLFRHLETTRDPNTPYPLNQPVIMKEPIK